jgi:glycosyltransferase
MKISIVTVCFNSSITILDTIKSVNNQSYKNIEHIFIDGLSSDNTLDIIKNNSIRSSVIISEKDNGLYDALNKGVNLATGDFIGFLHSDDVFACSNTISKIVDKLILNSFDGVYGNLDYVSFSQTDKIIRHWQSQYFKLDLLKNGWMPAHPTLFLSKDVYDKHGFFNLNYKIAADYDFMIRVLKDSTLNFGFIDTVITKMRVGGASNRSLKNIIKKSREDLKIINDHSIGVGIFILLKKNIRKINQFLKLK